MLCDKYYKNTESEGGRGATPRATCAAGRGVRQGGDKMGAKGGGKSVNQAERGGKLLRSLMAYFPPLALENSPRKGKRNVHCTVNVNEQEADK